MITVLNNSNNNSCNKNNSSNYMNKSHNTIYRCIKKYLSNKNNIFFVMKSYYICKEFKNNIKGYHYINNSPIKEAIWENINVDIVKDKCSVGDFANGNHKSGKDNKFNNWNISNKTCKFDEKGKTSVSSYRLTSVCSNRNKGKKEDIISEIEKRDLSFDYYSILGRKEYFSNNGDLEFIKYYWFIIPKDYYVFNVKKYDLEIKQGKNGKSKGKIVGWKSKYYDISFSMSSQLWFHFKFDDIKQYLISSVKVKICDQVLSYGDIYKLKK